MTWPEQATVLLVAAAVIVTLRLLNFYFPRGRYSKRAQQYSVPGDHDCGTIADAVHAELDGILGDRKHP